MIKKQIVVCGKTGPLFVKTNKENARISGEMISKEKLTKQQLQKYIQNFFAEKVKGQGKFALSNQRYMKCCRSTWKNSQSG